MVHDRHRLLPRETILAGGDENAARSTHWPRSADAIERDMGVVDGAVESECHQVIAMHSIGHAWRISVLPGLAAIGGNVNHAAIPASARPTGMDRARHDVLVIPRID